MNPNLQPQAPPNSSAGYKHILLRKLSYAVTCSVFSQLIILFWYIFVLNFSVLAPAQSVADYVRTLTSVGTWAYILMLSAVVFAQSIICAKDYIIAPRYCSTRFSKLKAIFSVHNLVLLNLHVFVGFACVWLFLGFTSFGLFVSERNKYVVAENTLYLLYLGAWTGFYYFISVYTSEKKVLFPVIQQMKWLQFKAHLFPILKKSKCSAAFPTIYYALVYGAFGRSLNAFLPLEIRTEASDFTLYLCAWFFAALIYFSLNLMNFYYELFLTEPLRFPIAACPSAEVTFTLKDALETDVPIIRHLACQDLFFLSESVRERHDRRQALFALSNPGNHPHNWNAIVKKILEIIKNYTDCLNSSLNNIMGQDKPKAVAESPKVDHRGAPKTKLRQMGVSCAIAETQARIEGDVYRVAPVQTMKNNLVENLTRKIDAFVFGLRERLGVNFMLRELPEANVQKCLGDGQVIVWLVQALSCLCTRSLEEDRYGVAQKDLPAIVSALIELRASVEKLGRLPALGRRAHGADDFNCQMKWGVANALKRAVYNIASRFGPYLKDLDLRQDVLAHLQGFGVRGAHY